MPKPKYKWSEDEPEDWYLYYSALWSIIAIPLMLLLLVITWK